jgi:L-2-hydroxyglutarate oxidase LhgO
VLFFQFFGEKMERTDVTIIGAGVVGLAVAHFIAQSGRSVMLLEKYDSFGQVTSSRNSEVIHASIYYSQNSLKGRLCLEGNEMMYEICRENKIPHKNTGKLIVATDEKQVAELPALLATAKGNGAKGVRIVQAGEIKEIEPKVFALAGIWCPSSGIVDSHSLMRFFEASAISNDANCVYNAEVDGLKRTSNGWIVSVRQGGSDEFQFLSSMVINCAGLDAWRIAEMAGIDIDSAGYRTNMRKGMYFRAMRKFELFPECLIYPVPPLPDTVGIHTVQDTAGGMRLGPHFVPAKEIEYSVDESLHNFIYGECHKFLPFLGPEDIQADMAGIQPDLHKWGEPSKDFVIRHEIDRGLPGLINLINIGSPGLTSSPAIGRKVCGMAEEYFEYFS